MHQAGHDAPTPTQVAPLTLKEFIEKLRRRWGQSGQVVTAMVQRLLLVGTITITVFGSVGAAWAVHHQVIGSNPWVCSPDPAKLCNR